MNSELRVLFLFIIAHSLYWYYAFHCFLPAVDFQRTFVNESPDVIEHEHKDNDDVNMNDDDEINVPGATIMLLLVMFFTHVWHTTCKNTEV